MARSEWVEDLHRASHDERYIGTLSSSGSLRSTTAEGRAEKDMYALVASIDSREEGLSQRFRGMASGMASAPRIPGSRGDKVWRP